MAGKMKIKSNGSKNTKKNNVLDRELPLSMLEPHLNACKKEPFLSTKTHLPLRKNPKSNKTPTEKQSRKTQKPIHAIRRLRNP
jgi:hypothetical protein